ncbi:Hypothetical predicted protein [Cloeon dipterum]|uniref:Uncharacterized protein n=1 Tax=Cloeon dipterum TaxID=197152 RepID=A0A8S1E6R3_9INSE|nr:Hypothetical predicted protein [Cloeon dipterum]
MMHKPVHGGNSLAHPIHPRKHSCSSLSVAPSAPDRVYTSSPGPRELRVSPPQDLQPNNTISALQTALPVML